jgi:two-component system chemotaxis response regulator CheY
MKSALLVDDSRTILTSISGILAKAGYTVQTASAGAEALTKLKGGLKPSVIITDLNMPSMDGIELIRQARAQPGCRFLPILMLTTESRADRRAEAKAAGATGWLVKPVAPAELLSILERVVPG